MRLKTSVKHELSLVSGEILLRRLKNIAYFEAWFIAEYELSLVLRELLLD